MCTKKMMEKKRKNEEGEKKPKSGDCDGRRVKK